MTHVVTLVLDKKNPTLVEIIEGHLLKKAIETEKERAEFIITEEINQEVKEVCLSYGIDLRMYQKPFPKGGKILPIPISKDSSFPYLLCKGREKMFTKEDLNLAILSLLKTKGANKNTQENHWIQDMVNTYQLPYKKIHRDSLGLTSLDNLSQACIHGRKQSSFSNKQMEMSYINLYLEKGSYLYEIGEMLQIIQHHMEEEHLDGYLFFVQDLYALRTTLYKVVGRDVEEENHNGLLKEEDMLLRLEKELRSSLTGKQKIRSLI